MRIGLLECDHVDEKFRHIGGDYRDMFERVLGVELRPYDVVGGDLPNAVDDCDAWLCGGSRQSVYDDDAWISSAAAFVRDVHGAGVPFAGVCFGHQLLAHALGGTVSKSEHGWGIGVRQVDVAAPEPWMSPPLDTPRLHFMHQDQVVQLPDGATLLGSTAHCPVAMFRVGRTMIGVQAHPEFDVPYVDALLTARVERMGAERVADARETFAHEADSEAVAGWLLEFLTGG